MIKFKNVKINYRASFDYEDLIPFWHHVCESFVFSFLFCKNFKI